MVIFFPKINTNRNLDMWIGLQLKDSSWRPQQIAGNAYLKGNMVLTKELSIETMEGIIKFIQEGNPQWSVIKDGCSQSDVQ